jgi:hypothetical protein
VPSGRRTAGPTSNVAFASPPHAAAESQSCTIVCECGCLNSRIAGRAPGVVRKKSPTSTCSGKDYDKNLVDQLFRLEGRVRQCVRCGWTDRTPESTCPICGSARLLTDLRAVLPPLARRYKVSTGSDRRGRRRKAKRGRRNRHLAEVKGETKNVSSSKYLSGAKTCTLPLASRDMCRRDRADTVGTELRDWAEINPVSVFAIRKKLVDVTGSNRRPFCLQSTLLCSNNSTTYF